jgi:hypothetical protein
MEPGIDGPRRDPENDPDLGRRQADVVRQDEHGALLDGEFEEGALEFVTIDDSGVAVGFLGRVDVERDDLHGPPARAASMVLTGSDQEAV